MTQPKKRSTSEVMTFELKEDRHFDVLSEVIISVVPHKWNNIGTYLGLSYTKLQAIEAASSKNSDRLSDVFGQWLRFIRCGFKQTSRLLCHNCTKLKTFYRRPFNTHTLTSLLLKWISSLVESFHCLTLNQYAIN